MRHIKIAIVGDIHDQWDGGDHLALSHLQPDLVLFVGDIGNEALPLVEFISTLTIPKAVILGNHDAWYTASEWGRKKSPYKNDGQGCRVTKQLEILGDCHVGYGYKDFPELGLSVVGGRPFSWGGAEWKNASFYAERFGVTDFQSSLDLICAQARQAQCPHLIFLGHNGPIGLGELPSSPCGRDWQPLGGDYGDPDFYSAIEVCRLTRSVPLVAFGHMHHHLRVQPYYRETIVVQNGTVYVNAACVPRWRLVGASIFRFFTVVHLVDYQVECVRQVWVDENGTIGIEVVTTIPTVPGNLCLF
ncbi:MAG: TIGR04168 family protein [Pseudanabaenaceae cyanobacterium SKYGB_i_bin29]|nr:TIGR04168 family protein [Pseudanabaenaceae cyanobacterium SKYG29]MDW8420685.1 TIGR04168 family protein [Pseudanabaenaceae cyanobacterium SKYGB_i_bin29]